MFLGFLFVALAILVAVATPLVMKYARDGELKFARRPGLRKKDKKKKGSSFKDMWEIKDIRQSVIIMPGGYSVVLGISPVNFMLMSEKEQHSIETALMQLVTALPAGSNVQFLTTTEVAEPEKGIKDIVEADEYAMEMVSYLDAITSQRNIYVRRSYAVVSCKTNRGFEYARSELMRRASILMNNLSRAKVSAYMLDTGQIVNLLHKMFNRGSMVKPTELVKNGALNLYKTGGKGVGSVEFKRESRAGEGSAEIA